MADTEFESSEHLGMETIEIKPRSCLIKTELEPNEDSEDCVADIVDNTDPMTEDTNYEEEYLYPVAVLTMENRPEEDIWNAGVLVKQEVSAEDLSEVGLQPPTRPVFQNIHTTKCSRPRVHVSETDEERHAEQRERNRLRKRRYRAGKSEESLARERERNKIYMRKIRSTLSLEQLSQQTQDVETDLEMCYMSRLEQNPACLNKPTSKRKPVSALTPEQLERQRERNRNYMRKVRAALYEAERKQNPIWQPGLINKRKPVIDLTPEQLERQRERNRNYMRRFRASLSEDELQQRRERDRLLKRKTREMMKEQTLKLKHFFSYEQQWNLMRQFYMNQMELYQVQNAHLYMKRDNTVQEEVQRTYGKEDSVSNNMISTNSCHFT